MSLAICPGSFDPITFGHIDVITRSAKMFPNVIVAIGNNRAKRYFFSEAERLELAQKALVELPNVQVKLFSGLISDFALQQQATALVKGIRGVGDFAAEETMALLNRELCGIETIFLPTDPQVAHIASSYVKEIAAYHGALDKLVPANVAAALMAKIIDPNGIAPATKVGNRD